LSSLRASDSGRLRSQAEDGWTGGRSEAATTPEARPHVAALGRLMRGPCANHQRWVQPTRATLGEANVLEASIQFRFAESLLLQAEGAGLEGRRTVGKHCRQSTDDWCALNRASTGLTVAPRSRKSFGSVESIARIPAADVSSGGRVAPLAEGSQTGGLIVHGACWRPRPI
jgi:hypothetical protein